MEPRLIEFPYHPDLSGNLYVADQGVLPFVPMRIFWMDNLHGERGNHALRRCHQIIIAVKGNFFVSTNRGTVGDESWFMSPPNKGLYLPPLTWRSLRGFSSSAVCLVLASHPYDPDDYIHDYDEFAKYLMDNELQKGIKFSDEIS